MRLDTRKPLPSITILSANQSNIRAEIVFRHPDNRVIRAVAWLDATWPHSDRAWTVEILSHEGEQKAAVWFSYLYEQGCSRETGADLLTRELVRILSVSVLPAFD